MIKSQLWYFVHTEPFRFGCIIATFYFCNLHKSEKGNRDDTFTRITIWICETMKLLYIIRRQIGFFF